MASDQTRARVIEAAGELFAAKGFRDATVREICDAAGVGLASVNYHFRDKQQLYVHVVQHAYECLHSDGADGLADVPPMPPAERLAEWIRRLTRKVIGEREETWQYRLFKREIQDPTELCEDFLQAKIQADLEPLFEILAQVMPANTSDAQRWLVVRSVLGQALFYDTYSRLVRLMARGSDDAGEPSPEQVAEHITRFCLAALGMGPSLRHSDTGAVQ